MVLPQDEPRDSNGNRPRDYDRWGVEPPTHEEHGIRDEDILSSLVPTSATRWWMEGNMLKAETNHGVLAQRIPPEYICMGTDKDMMPIFKKVAS